MKAFLDAVQKVRAEKGWMLEVDWRHLNPPLTSEQDKDIDAYLSSFEEKGEGRLFSLHNRLFVYWDKRGKDSVHALKNKIQFCNDLMLLTAGQEICRSYVPQKDKAFLKGVFEETVQKGELSAFLFFEGDSNALTPESLAVFEKIFSFADVTPFLRSQPICFIGDKKSPLPVAEGVFVSVSELKKTVCPALDIESNSWLYQRWRQKLDLAYLRALLSYPFPLCRLHISLSVISVLSAEFKAFDAHLTPLQRHNTTIEFALPDVMTYFKTFERIVPVLRKRGYQIALDKVTPKTYALLTPQMMNADKIKLCWSPELYKTVSSKGFLNRLKETGTSKLILAQADDKNVLPIGEALQIKHYQGCYIQKLLFKATGPKTYQKK